MKLFIGLLPFLLLVACGDEPPELTMETEESRISGSLGTYSWTSGPIGGEEASGSLPTEAVEILDMETVAASPGETAELEFSDRSSPEISAATWEEHEPVDSLATNEKSVTLPDETGEHVIEIYADWSDYNNQAHYTFLINIVE
ncbi:hypothetical protein [Salisediminibacterium halotolerans]|uniref:YtkA-like n=1 Tax=Salisediminibacterium halotolerans TaxID=517425 RepID=A0A1H9U797_9BACI|nr:hypothetical protein [Salisediminibacterium haloalkalitolerans]SES05192.1 hypothetical protein SAMN05444126_1135 [Salisediminibacterium haloalkalitolerans]